MRPKQYLTRRRIEEAVGVLYAAGSKEIKHNVWGGSVEIPARRVIAGELARALKREISLQQLDWYVAEHGIDLYALVREVRAGQVKQTPPRTSSAPRLVVLVEEPMPIQIEKITKEKTEKLLTDLEEHFAKLKTKPKELFSLNFRHGSKVRLPDADSIASLAGRLTHGNLALFTPDVLVWIGKLMDTNREAVLRDLANKPEASIRSVSQSIGWSETATGRYLWKHNLCFYQVRGEVAAPTPTNSEKPSDAAKQPIGSAKASEPVPAETSTVVPGPETKPETQNLKPQVSRTQTLPPPAFSPILETETPLAPPSASAQTSAFPPLTSEEIEGAMHVWFCMLSPFTGGGGRFLKGAAKILLRDELTRQLGRVVTWEEVGQVNKDFDLRSLYHAQVEQHRSKRTRRVQETPQASTPAFSPILETETPEPTVPEPGPKPFRTPTLPPPKTDLVFETKTPPASDVGQLEIVIAAPRVSAEILSGIIATIPVVNYTNQRKWFSHVGKVPSEEFMAILCDASGALGLRPEEIKTFVSAGGDLYDLVSQEQLRRWHTKTPPKKPVATGVANAPILDAGTSTLSDLSSPGSTSVLSSAGGADSDAKRDPRSSVEQTRTPKIATLPVPAAAVDQHVGELLENVRRRIRTREEIPAQTSERPVRRQTRTKPALQTNPTFRSPEPTPPAFSIGALDNFHTPGVIQPEGVFPQRFVPDTRTHAPTVQVQVGSVELSDILDVIRTASVPFALEDDRTIGQRTVDSIIEELQTRPNQTQDGPQDPVRPEDVRKLIQENNARVADAIQIRSIKTDIETYSLGVYALSRRLRCRSEGELIVMLRKLDPELLKATKSHDDNLQTLRVLLAKNPDAVRSDALGRLRERNPEATDEDLVAYERQTGVRFPLELKAKQVEKPKGAVIPKQLPCPRPIPESRTSEPRETQNPEPASPPPTPATLIIKPNRTIEELLAADRIQTADRLASTKKASAGPLAETLQSPTHKPHTQTMVLSGKSAETAEPGFGANVDGVLSAIASIKPNSKVRIGTCVVSVSHAPTSRFLDGMARKMGISAKEVKSIISTKEFKQKVPNLADHLKQVWQLGSVANLGDEVAQLQTNRPDLISPKPTSAAPIRELVLVEPPMKAPKAMPVLEGTSSELRGPVLPDPPPISEEARYAGLKNRILEVLLDRNRGFGLVLKGGKQPQHPEFNADTIENIVTRTGLDVDVLLTPMGENAIQGALTELRAHIEEEQKHKATYRIAKDLKLTVTAVKRIIGLPASDLGSDSKDPEADTEPIFGSVGLIPEQVYAALERVQINPFIRSLWFAQVAQVQNSESPAAPRFVATYRFYRALSTLLPKADLAELGDLVETQMPDLYVRVLKIEANQNVARGPVTRVINGKKRSFRSENAADEYELRYVDYDSLPESGESDAEDDHEGS